VLKMADRAEALQRDWGKAREAAESEAAALQRLDFAADAARGGLPAQLSLAESDDPGKKLN